MSVSIFRAKYALSSDFALAENPTIRCENGQITDITTSGQFESGASVTDFGDALILPGLINAHTHLELGSLKEKVSTAFSFVDWLKNVIEYKANLSKRQAIKNAADGASECISNGATTIADISSLSSAIKPLLKCLARKFIFIEVIDAKPRRSQGLGNFARQTRRILQTEYVKVGISPHAPYTVSEKMFNKILELSPKQRFRLQIHTSETEEENEFFEKNSGPLKRFFDVLEITQRIRSPGISPVKYLERLGILGERTMLVHCNYVSAADVEIIARSSSSIVFCPGSHRFFGRASYPLVDYLKAGINVAIGTDSKVSNQELNILREMSIIRESFDQVSTQDIVRMATINGAKALGMADKVGRLASGFSCDLSVVSIEGGNLSRIDHLFDLGRLANRATVIGGKVVFSKDL